MGKHINKTLATGLKYCSKCEKVRPTSEFYKDKGKKDGLFYYCKFCSKLAAKQWQSDNWNKVLSNVSKYGKKNPDKKKRHQQKRDAIKRGSHENTLTKREWDLILKEFQFLCAYCPSLWEQQDHFIPLSKGGTHTADNVVPACGPCNRKKAAKMPLDWINAKNPDSI